MLDPRPLDDPFGWPDPTDPVARDHPLNAGKVAWWLAVPEGTGGSTWVDLVGNLAGTLAGAAAWQGATRPGAWGHLAFNGANAAVGLGTPPALELYQNFSVFAWINTPSAGTGYVVAKDFSTGARGWCLGVGGSKLWIEGAGSLLINAGPTLTGTGWHRIGFANAGGTWTGYVDGASVGAAGAALTPNAAAPTYLGRRAYVGAESYFSGAIDDVDVWGRALSAAEVLADYAAGPAGYPGALARPRSAWPPWIASAYRPPRARPLVAAAPAGQASPWFN